MKKNVLRELNKNSFMIPQAMNSICICITNSTVFMDAKCNETSFIFLLNSFEDHSFFSVEIKRALKVNKNQMKMKKIFDDDEMDGCYCP